MVQWVKNMPASAGDTGDPWVGKVPWRREWQPTPGFLPGYKESHMTEWLSTQPGDIHHNFFFSPYQNGFMTFSKN